MMLPLQIHRNRKFNLFVILNNEHNHNQHPVYAFKFLWFLSFLNMSFILPWESSRFTAWRCRRQLPSREQNKQINVTRYMSHVTLINDFWVKFNIMCLENLDSCMIIFQVIIIGISMQLNIFPRPVCDHLSGSDQVFLDDFVSARFLFDEFDDWKVSPCSQQPALLLFILSWLPVMPRNYGLRR